MKVEPTVDFVNYHIVVAALYVTGFIHYVAVILMIVGYTWAAILFAIPIVTLLPYLVYKMKNIMLSKHYILYVVPLFAFLMASLIFFNRHKMGLNFKQAFRMYLCKRCYSVPLSHVKLPIDKETIVHNGREYYLFYGDDEYAKFLLKHQ